MGRRNHSQVSEKPKIKRRRLRDNVAEVRPRVAREEARPNDEQLPRTQKYFLGSCEPHTCGTEAACLQNGTYHYCVCYSDALPATDDFKCPRSTVPVTPMPIYNVIPPNISNTTESRYTPPTMQTLPKSDLSENFGAVLTNDSRIQGEVMTGSTGILVVVLVSGLTVLAAVVLLVVWYLRRRMSRVENKAQPRVRPGEPLLPERYITNPQYGVYGAGAGAGAPVAAADDTEDERVPRLDRNSLIFLEEVGEGCFGKVHKGVLQDIDSEQIVAIKVLKESAGRSAEEDFLREVSIMSAFRHPNILSLLGVVKDTPWMVFEYMEWGDLAGVLRGSRGGGRPGPALNDSILLDFSLQVALGMQYLASRRFVHRDLAARNCLVGTHLTVKIADFGMSRDVYTCDYYKMGGQRPMPVRWMSPESILYARFTHESDVWSYGVVLWEIYSRGKQPFYGHNNDSATKLILNSIHLVPPEGCPRFACDIMRSCWRASANDRITFDEICKKLSTVREGGGGLPLPPQVPPPAQDPTGYLIPRQMKVANYLTLPPDNVSSERSGDEEEDDDEYT